MYPHKSRIRELQTHFDVSNGQIFADPRYTNLNWYLGNSRNESTFEHLEWFCYGDIRDDDIDRLMPLLKVDEKLILGWKDLQPNTGDDTHPLNEGNKVWLYIISFGVMLDKRVGYEKNHVFTLDENNIPKWEKIITAEGMQ